MTSKTTAPEPVKSTSQRDLEDRQREDYVSPIAKAKTVGPNETLVNEDGFVGVSSEYANNANETDAPLSSDEGPEKILEDKLLGSTEDAPVEDKKDEGSAKHAAPAAPSTPAPSTPDS